MFLKDLYIHIFNSLCPIGASLFFCLLLSPLFSSVCSFYGTINWAPATFLVMGDSPGCRWLEIQPEISVQLMNYSLHLTPTSHQALNTIRVPPARETLSQSHSLDSLLQDILGKQMGCSRLM